MKSRGGKSQRREENTKEHQGRKRVRRQKMQVREKVAKWFVAPEGRKVGSLKRWVRSHVVRWKIKVACRRGAKQISMSNCTKHTNVGPLLEVEISKKCTPLWCEAHLEFKVWKTDGSGALLEVEMSKKCVPLWREALFEVKMYKTHQVRATFGSWDVEKVHAVLAQSTFFEVTNVKNTQSSDYFWRFRCGFAWQAQGILHLAQKLAKRENFVEFPKMLADVGHLQRICKDAIHVAGAVQETCSSEMLRGQGADFLREVAFSSIRSSVLGRWFCVAGAALRMTWHHLCVAGAALYTDGVEKSQNALARGRQLCTQFSIVEGSLAELFCFWCCQLRKLRKSRR